MKVFWKYFFPPLYSLVIYFTIRVLLDTVTGMKFWHRSWGLNSIEMGACAIMGYVLIGGLNRLARYFDAKWETGFSYKRVAKELGIVVVAVVLFQNIFILPIPALTDDGLQWYDFADVNIIPLLYAIIYYGVMRSNTFLNAWVNNRLKLEKVMNDQLQTELKFLKAQFHPHFLFNALNTIYFQLYFIVADAKKSIEQFSELLRYQLYDQQQTVNIGQEMNYLQNFIDLQKARTSEKLQLSVTLDKKLDGRQVYPLLFLPLVENAFKYVGGDYRLNICARQLDKGIGFKVENSVPAESPVKKDCGIGLENLKRRLELLYPGRHSLVTNQTGNTFTAALHLEFNEP